MRPRTPSAYPREYFDLLEELVVTDSIEITLPSLSHAYTMRANLYVFMKSLREAGEQDFAKLFRALIVSRRIGSGNLEPKGVELESLHSKLGMMIAKSADLTIQITGPTLKIIWKSSTWGARALRDSLNRAPTPLPGVSASLTKLLDELKEKP